MVKIFQVVIMEEVIIYQEICMDVGLHLVVHQVNIVKIHKLIVEKLIQLVKHVELVLINNVLVKVDVVLQ